MAEGLPDDYVCKKCGLPVLGSAPGDTCGPCLDDEEGEDNRDTDPYRDDETEMGCVFPGECCMPGLHLKSECHTAAMLLQQEYEALIEDYKEQIEDLEYALKNIYNGTLDRPQDLDIGYKSQEMLASIVKTTHFSAKGALDKSDHTSKARFPSMMPEKVQ